MFPAATAATFARNVVHRGILAFFQFLLGLATFSNGLSRYAGRAMTGRIGRFPEAQRRGTVRPVRRPIHYGCQYVASRAVTVTGSSRFSRSNQGLRRLSRFVKTLCG